MVTHEKTEVLVIGAGPVGLFAALCLTERGLRVRILDKYHRSALHSYALLLHPGTLRLLDERGMAGELVNRGRKIERIGLYRDADRVGELDLRVLGGPYGFGLVLPQTMLEAALEERLQEVGIDVAWNHQALSLQAENGTVRTLIARVDETALNSDDGSIDGAMHTWVVHSSFVIGADGYESLTRGFLGVRYATHGGHQNYRLCEFDSPTELPSDARIVLREDSTSVLWPIGMKRGRWGLQVSGPLANHEDPQTLLELIRARAPWFDALPESIDWTTNVTFEHHLAERVGEGRVWLAGDAAHLTGPVGVQNMNVALREVHDLAGRLTAIQRNGAPLGSLEQYEVERQEEWRVLLGLDDRLEALHDAPEWVAGFARRLVSCIPASGDDLGILLSQIGIAHASSPAARPRSR